MPGPLDLYRDRLAAGRLRPDPAQAAAAERLQRLFEALAASGEEPRNGLFGGLLGRRRPPASPRGLYLWGGVGRGKSMLMDLLVESRPHPRTRRVHFHAFMLEVQRRLHAARGGANGQPIETVAAAIAAETRLLCFDEFHVFNIADAMILGRLFTALFDAGLVVVATSNVAPDRLYWGGLQRDLFVPFIELLQARVEVLALNGPVDYRLEALRDARTYLWPLGHATDRALDQLFATLTDGAAGVPDWVPVGSRRLAVPCAANGVARFSFKELCEMPVGAADYLALTERFHTVVVEGVPVLTPDKRSEARRFVTLVDAFYERRVVLVVSAEAPPEQLYPEGEGAFEFRRTVSRLNEMQSLAWIGAARRREGAVPAADFRPFALTTDLV